MATPRPSLHDDTAAKVAVADRRGLLLGALAATMLPGGGAMAAPAAARLSLLDRGINLTNWFRFPARRDAAFFRAHMPDADLKRLAAAGFRHARICVGSDVVGWPPDPAMLSEVRDAVLRVHDAGLAVVVGPHMQRWAPERVAEDRDRLVGFWRALAPLLATTDARRTFPDVVNEPVFENAPEPWAQLQARTIAVIRQAMPGHTLVASGIKWSSIGGMASSLPPNDPNAVMTFHTYDPPLLTTEGAFIPGADRAALRRLPWPVEDRATCRAAAQTEHEATKNAIIWYCSEPRGRAQLDRHVAAAVAWRERHQVPVICGEFGIAGTLPAAVRRAWLSDMRGAFEAERIGWALWGFEDFMGFGRRTPGAPLDPMVLAALGLRAA